MKNRGLLNANTTLHFVTRKIISKKKERRHSKTIGSFLTKIVLCLFLFVNIAHSQITDYNQLNDQEQADFSRWLGWVWGDGIPNNLTELTGIKYTGPTKAAFNSRYNVVMERLKDTDLGITVASNGTNNRRLLQPWNYWLDAIPGGRAEDSQLLRDAVKNPNFLAGIIDTEGGGGNNYYIDDHFFGPSHPDETKAWGIRNFGPNRMIQLYHLLGDTYGFEKTAMQIGTQGELYTYSDPTQRQAAIDRIIEKFNSTEASNLNGVGKTIRVRVYIHPDDWGTLRSYGYWSFPARYPPSGGELVELSDSYPRADLENVGGPDYVLIQHKSTNKLLTSNLELTDSANGDETLWQFIDLGDGYYRIVSKANNQGLRAISGKLLTLAPENFTGFQTQWKLTHLSNGSYLIFNRWRWGKYLRVNNSTTLRHGSSGATAQWNFIDMN